MVDSWKRGMKTMGRLGLAVAGAALLLVATTGDAMAVTNIAIVSPGNEAALTESSPQISGTSEAAGTVTVEVRSGASTVQTLNANASAGVWTTAPVEPLKNGSYSVVAKQTDPETTEVDTTPERPFTVSRALPSVSLTPLAAVEGTASPTFGGTAEAGDGPVVLHIYRGTAVSTTEAPLKTVLVAPTGGTWSKSVGLPEDNTYTAIAEQSDNAGNTGESVPSTFTVKTAGPAVSLNPTAAMTRNPAPGFSGGAGIAFGDNPAVTLAIYSGTAVVPGHAFMETGATVSGGIWTAAPAAALADGVYTAVAVQTDQAHHTGLSVAETFTVDTTAPAPTLSAPASSTGAENVGGAAGVAPGDLPAITVQVFAGPASAGQSPVETVIVNASGASWSATLAGLATGTYTARAAQSDEAGNTGVSAESSFTVASAGSAAPSPPTASFTWVPATPAAGQSVSLVSNSTNGSSAIGAFAWDLAGNGSFAPGGSVMTTSFATAGPHVVHLQVTDGNGLSSVATRTISVAPPLARLMQPFPIVRIAGAETGSGVRIRLLTVQAPLSAKVSVTCKGSGCKTKSESRVATASAKSKVKSGAVMLTFQRFERPLRAGVVLQIRVTKAGQIGKFTSFKIRRHKLPLRSDSCLSPTSSTPVACPTS
jgi:hypothetical protein